MSSVSGTRPSEPLENRASRSAEWGSRNRVEPVLLLLLAFPVVLTLAALVYRSTLFIQINYNEGWNAYHSMAAISGAQLYFPTQALVTNNYPPLSFFITGAIAQIAGDAVFAGRFVSWLSFLSLGGIIAAVLRTIGCGWTAALCGTLLCFAYSVVNFTSYIGMDDPQWLGQSVMLAGLLVYLRHVDKHWSSVAAGLLMAVGLFVKHNIIALPVALTLWLWIYDRSSCGRFVIAGCACAAAGLVLCVAGFGRDFVSGLLAPRAYSLISAYQEAFRVIVPMQIPIALTALSAIYVRDRFAFLFAIYLVTSLIIGIVVGSGAGTNFNRMFDAMIAFCLACGYLVDRVSTQKLRFWVIGTCAWTIVITAGATIDRDVLVVVPWFRALHMAERQTQESVRLIASRPGLAICLDPVLCYWAHKKFVLDPFNFRQGVLAGAKDEHIVADGLRSGRYSTVEVAAPQQHTDYVVAALSQSFMDQLFPLYQPIGEYPPEMTVIYARRSCPG